MTYSQLTHISIHCLAEKQVKRYLLGASLSQLPRSQRLRFPRQSLESSRLLRL